MTPADIAAGLSRAPSHSTLRFSVCTVPGKKGYSAGWVTTDSEETIRLLCAMWNQRDAIAKALLGVPTP